MKFGHCSQICALENGLGAAGSNHGPPQERAVRVEVERRGLPSQADPYNALDRSERYWRLQDGKLAETCSGSRRSHGGSAAMASADAVSVARKLGVRESTKIKVDGRIYRSRSCNGTSFPSRESWASQSESAGILLGTRIRRCFDLPVQS